MNCNNNTAPLVGSSAASSCNNGCSPKDINVICRKIIIPYGQGILAIEGDENSSSRTFIIPDTTEEGISLVDKTFSILVENANKQQWRTVVTDEDKIIEDNYIKIKWDIGKNETAVAGILKVSLEAEGENFKWQTYSGDFSIASSLYDEDRQIDPSLNLQTKDINRNGRYYPDPGYNGFSAVNVNIELDFIPTAEKGAPNGVATLDELGKVFVSQLPEGVVIDNNYVHTDNNFTNTDKEKLNNLSNYDDTQVKSDINIINEKIPTQATNNNQLADKDFVNSSLNSITAFYITKNANGDQFNSKAELDSATEFYSGGEVRVPTRNDYCIVLEDETKENSTTRYIYQNEQWEFQYIVNETPLTSEQIKAINSGITPELVAKLQGIALTDVQINNTSIVTDGVANIPCGIPFEYSMAKFSNNVYGNWVYSGVFLDSSGSVRLPNVSDEQIINSMDGNYQIVPVLSRNIRTSVKTAMCDGKGDEWTEDEKLKAQERIGVSKIPSGMTLTADVILEESVERVDFNEIIVKNYEKLIIYVFRPATIFSSGYGSISFASNVGGGLGGTDYNAFSTNQKINVRHTMVKTDGTKFEVTSEWVNAGNNINDTAFIKSAYKPDVNPYSGYLVINTTQTFPIGTHILIYTK